MNRRARWFAVSVFALASAWNYMDRTLISAQSPRIIKEFHLSNEGYGWLNSAFSLAYAIGSPFVGWFLDWLGLETGVLIAVGLWSVATILTGFTQTYGQLLVARAFLGIWESAGVPAAGKLNSTYLDPKDRAIGAGITQVGISIGTVAVLVMVSRIFVWRQPFLLAGILGLCWIPLWVLVRRGIRPTYPAWRQGAASLQLLRDRRLIVIAAANILWMLGYGFWALWTTPYLVYRFHLTTAGAAGYAWTYSIGALLGGFAGGLISRRAIERNNSVASVQIVAARTGAVLISAFGCLCTLLVPLCPGPVSVAAMIGFSMFWIVAGSANIYTIPVDLWGPEKAGITISALVFSYGLAQAVISPIIGRIVDRSGYNSTFWLVALPPLAAWALLHWALPQNTANQLQPKQL